MIYNYKAKDVYYKWINKGKTCPIILLHGWGVDSSIFEDFCNSFPEKTFLLLDFPPFGKSEKNIEGWDIFSYAGLVLSLCDYLKIEKCHILGHSFGGRIAIILSAVRKDFILSCVLVDSAGMKPKRTLSYRLKKLSYNIKKKLKKDISSYGSADYKKLSPNMKKTFQSIVNTHLEDYAKKITIKTLLVWGKNDKETPLYMAKRLNKIIKKSQLKIIDSAGHFPFLEYKFIFNDCLESFWEEV